MGRRGKNIIVLPDGRFRAYTSVNGEQKQKTFPRGTKPTTLQNWLEDTRATLRTKAKQAEATEDTPPSLSVDIDRYLLQVRAMPTYAQREEHLLLWRDALGANRPRSEITAGDIRAVLHDWRRRYSAATCNKRRAALMHLWSVLDGKGASNPVRDVPKFPVEDPLPRGRDPHTIDAALLKAPKCRSRACARVLLWTGMRPEELLRAQPDDVNLEQRTVVVRTAKGGRARVVPLTSQAVSAWREFAAAGCWDAPDNRTLTKKHRQPRRRAEHRIPHAAPLGRWLKSHTGVRDLRVYDLRHSYGTALARQQTRLDVIGALMGHSTLELTKRYTLAAVTPDALAATSKLGQKRRPEYGQNRVTESGG